MKYQWDDSIDKGDDDLRIVKLCYMYASFLYLQKAGLPLSRQEKYQMTSLERLLVGDPLCQKRQHRRISTLLPATLKIDTEIYTGIVHNISGSGMYVASSKEVTVGKQVAVELHRPGQPKYIFTCTVQRQELAYTSSKEPFGLGLKFCSMPTKVE
jgi:Tfp pilus assembly protein PilZ